MRCPKCQFDHELQTTECLKCGIVFTRYLAALEAAAKQADLGLRRPCPLLPLWPSPPLPTTPSRKRDLRCRADALRS